MKELRVCTPVGAPRAESPRAYGARGLAPGVLADAGTTHRDVPPASDRTLGGATRARAFIPWSHAFVAATLLLLAAVAAPAAHAIDHDNVDAGRPLRFEDAESIGLRERALEYGLSPTWARGARMRTGLSAEYLFGAALNTFYSVDFDGDDRGLGRTGIGLFHNVRRETLARPGLSVRVDTMLPTGSDPDSNRGVDVRLRGIASRTLRGNERAHLNLDSVFRTAAAGGARSFVPSATLGYTRPLGYPRRFDRTALAELGVRAGDDRGALVSIGAGLRQQVTPRAVFDVGVQSDIAAPGGAGGRERLRLVAGYSTSF